MLWLTVLTLGTLRSPFAPIYMLLPAFWIFTLWSPEIRSTAGVIKLALAWILLANTPLLSLQAIVAITLVQQCALVAILTHLILRATPADTSPDGPALAPEAGLKPHRPWT